MKYVYEGITDKLQEIVSLQTEVKVQEEKYAALLKADEPLETLREIRLKIKYLKVELKAKEDHVLALLNRQTHCEIT